MTTANNSKTTPTTDKKATKIKNGVELDYVNGPTTVFAPIPINAKATYKKEWNELGKKAAMLGMTYEEMAAKVFATTEDNLKTIILENPEFARAILEGLEFADMDIAGSLHKLATGFEYEEEMMVPGHGVAMVKKQSLPNIQAIKYWLNNRASNKWADKKEHNMSGQVNGVTKLVIVDADDDGL